jgi:putative transposase
MPVQSRPADDHPRHTPSFVCAVPLRVRPAQERTLLARLEAARQVYNACLGEARTRVGLVRESKAFQRAQTLPRDDPDRQRLFHAARQHQAIADYALQGIC